MHENVLPLVERVLDPGCLVASLNAINILPGEGPRPLHADDELLPISRPHPPLVCNSIWALDDFTAENGAPQQLALPESLSERAIGQDLNAVLGHQRARLPQERGVLAPLA